MTDTAALLGEVYANPDDDAPRLVYADWLQQRDDPRGELIALQIARANGRAKSGQRKREDELLAKHTLTWSRPLGVRTREHITGLWQQPSVVFERGFPVAVSIGAINHDPGWATVRTCTVPPTDDACHARSLRIVTAARDSHVLALGKLTRPLAIEELSWGFVHDPKRAWSESVTGTITSAAIDVFRACRWLALRRFELSPSVIGVRPIVRDVSWAWGRLWVPELTTLMIPSHPLELTPWINAIDPTKIRTLELAMAGTIGYGWHHDARAILSRGDAGQLSQLTIVVQRSTRNILGQIETALDPRLEQIRVAISTVAEYDKSQAERRSLARNCERAGVALVIEKASK